MATLDFSKAKDADPWKAERYTFSNSGFSVDLSTAQLTKVRTGIQNWLKTENPKIQNNGFWRHVFEGQAKNGGMSAAEMAGLDSSYFYFGDLSAFSDFENALHNSLMQEYFGGNVSNIITGEMDYKYPPFYYDMQADKIPLERFAQLKNTGITYLRDGKGFYNGEDFQSTYDAYAADYTERQEEEAKDIVIGGFEDYADTEGGSADIKNLPDASDSDLFQGYESQSDPKGTSSYKGKSPIDPNSQLYTYGKEAKANYKETKYVKGRIPKTTGMRAVLGEEIFNLGLKDEEGNFITPESLSQFATYNTEEDTEKPLIEYENALLDKMQKGGKDPGVDARSLLAIRAKQGVIGAASAAGKSLQQTVQDATMDKMAGRQAASSAMSARVSAIEDRMAARQQLSKLKTELLSHNLKREQALYKMKSKAAVGMAGLEETAASFAAEMAQIKK